MSTGACGSILGSPVWPRNQKLTMSLRGDTMSFWFWGCMGDVGTELQAPVL